MGIEAQAKTKTVTASAADFHYYVGGERFDVESLDVTRSGAFVATDVTLPLGTVVLISLRRGRRTQGEQRIRSLPVLIVGMVASRKEAPDPGLGLRWMRCVSKAGLLAICDFLEFLLGESPDFLPNPAIRLLTASRIMYDFTGRRWLLPGEDKETDAGENKERRTPPASPPELSARSGSVRPPRPETAGQSWIEDGAPLPPSRGFSSAPETGEITASLRDPADRINVFSSVKVLVDGEERHAVLRDVGLLSMYVALSGSPGEGIDRIAVQLRVPRNPGVATLLIHCKVSRTEPLAGQEALGYELMIDRIEGEPEPHLYDRYIKFLFERQIFKSR